jgi:hypothetical protein
VTWCGPSLLPSTGPDPTRHGRPLRTATTLNETPAAPRGRPPSYSRLQPPLEDGHLPFETKPPKSKSSGPSLWLVTQKLLHSACRSTCRKEPSATTT